ncbi:hypothetical protein [Alicyclobacillus acidocaldarius]|uniref:hypothetical protein n=1 Tax=Alicyclobacillus acidocaldarius TaxID=405212 RepID=UPI0011D23492|nr:hypothetical protein [Alicyclobacillus acidocaldarius]
MPHRRLGEQKAQRTFQSRETAAIHLGRAQAANLLEFLLPNARKSPLRIRMGIACVFPFRALGMCA